MIQIIVTINKYINNIVNKHYGRKSVPQATITINAPAKFTSKDFDVENMVSKPTWKQILLELIDKKIDPWDVVVKLCQECLKR